MVRKSTQEYMGEWGLWGLMGFRLIDRCRNEKLLDVNMRRGVTGGDYFLVEMKVGGGFGEWGNDVPVKEVVKIELEKVACVQRYQLRLGKEWTRVRENETRGVEGI